MDGQDSSHIHEAKETKINKTGSVFSKNINKDKGRASCRAGEQG